MTTGGSHEKKKKKPFGFHEYVYEQRDKNQDGWERALDGTRVYRTALAQSKIGGGVSQTLRHRDTRKKNIADWFVFYNPGRRHAGLERMATPRFIMSCPLDYQRPHHNIPEFHL